MCRLQDVQDDDDYFQVGEDLSQLCIPDLPPGFNTESDSIDLDDVPCVIEPEEAALIESMQTSSSGTSHLQTEAAGRSC